MFNSAPCFDGKIELPKLDYSQEYNIHYLSCDHFALFAYFAVINNSDEKTLFSNILPPQRAQSSQRVSLICLVFNYKAKAECHVNLFGHLRHIRDCANPVVSWKWDLRRY